LGLFKKKSLSNGMYNGINDVDNLVLTSDYVHVFGIKSSWHYERTKSKTYISLVH